jgi:uncharacterized membrane protein HdeD (DUF308 family)
MTSDAATHGSHRRAERLLSWFTIARGCLALSLGVALLLQREGTSETLATFMGLKPPTEEETFILIGLLVTVAGLTNLVSGARTGADTARRWNPTSLILGLLEVLLGVGLIVRGGAPGPVLILATTAWALTAGIVLVGQRISIERRATVRRSP